MRDKSAPALEMLTIILSFLFFFFPYSIEEGLLEREIVRSVCCN